MSDSVRGYIHDPKEKDGPHIAVVLRDGAEPVITVHTSYAEAERELKKQLALLKVTTLSHENSSNS